MLEDLDEILAPTLVLWGDHDSFTTVNDQKELSLAFPNSHFKVYSGNGHAIHWEEPEKFSKDLIEFIEKNVQ
jgi:pimeloyl-ACP methyl ester carboxylesterase